MMTDIEALRQILSQSLHAVTLGRMMAGSNIMNAQLTRHMGCRLGNLTT